MSGGAFNYEYSNVEWTYCKRMEDVELNGMMQDLVELLRQLEWWKSGDTCESDYRETVQEFKRKWMRRSNEDILQTYIAELDKKYQELKKQMALG